MSALDVNEPDVKIRLKKNEIKKKRKIKEEEVIT